MTIPAYHISSDRLWLVMTLLLGALVLYIAPYLPEWARASRRVWPIGGVVLIAYVIGTLLRGPLS